MSFHLYAQTSFVDVVRHANDLQTPDRYTLVSSKSFLDGHSPLNTDGSINAVVEIPTGSTAKWEVSKPDGHLKWEIRNGSPRIVNYLGYPGNYGMIPRTILPKELGGDGDPLDVLVLGPSVPRGSIIKAKLIGVLHLLDNKEQDDKLIAVMENTPLYEADTLKELNDVFPGISVIIETWFTHYKGPGVMQSQGFSDKEKAEIVLQSAIQAFSKQHTH